MSCTFMFIITIMIKCQQIKVETIKGLGHFRSLSHHSVVKLYFSLRTSTFLNCSKTNWMLLFVTAIVLVFITETGTEA
jgi:hypothetical protein